MIHGRENGGCGESSVILLPSQQIVRNRTPTTCHFFFAGVTPPLTADLRACVHFDRITNNIHNT